MQSGGEQKKRMPMLKRDAEAQGISTGAAANASQKETSKQRKQPAQAEEAQTAQLVISAEQREKNEWTANGLKRLESIPFSNKDGITIALQSINLAASDAPNFVGWLSSRADQVKARANHKFQEGITYNVVVHNFPQVMELCRNETVQQRNHATENSSSSDTAQQRSSTAAESHIR